MLAVRIVVDGRVTREIVGSRLPLTIGRDPGCDILLADVSVSRIHARLEESEGEIRIVDAGGRNGLRVNGRNVASAAVTGSLRARLGNVTIEVEHAPDDAPTIEIAVREAGADRRRGPAHVVAAALSAGVSVAAASAIDPAFWSPWNKARGIALLGDGLMGVAGAVGLGLALFVIYKALGRRVRIADTFSATAWASVLLLVTAALRYLLYYAVTPGTLSDVGPAFTGVSAAIAVAILAGVRRSPFSWRFSGGIAAGTLAGLALTNWIDAQTKVRNGVPWADFSVQAPLGSITGSARSLDDFLTNAGAVARRAHERAAEIEAEQREP